MQLPIQFAISLFLSTHSVRSATMYSASSEVAISISIHALRKECDFTMPSLAVQDEKISIHALRKECDLKKAGKYYKSYFISIHALRKECDYNQMSEIVSKLQFLSTHSVRSATADPKSGFNNLNISIHALRKECDLD